MENWKFESFIEVDKEFRVNGLNIWNYHWYCSDRKVEVLCPHEGQMYFFKEYKIKDGEKEVVFVAGEFSNAKVGLYVLDEARKRLI